MPVGQLDRRQPLVDELPGEVDVGAVLERHDDLRQAELRDRPHALQAGQAADRLLDRKRDPLLDFFRPERRRDGVDLHLDRRRVGKGIDIEIAQRHAAHRRQRHDAGNDQQAVPQRKVDDPVQHGRVPPACVAYFVRRRAAARSPRPDCS